MQACNCTGSVVTGALHFRHRPSAANGTTAMPCTGAAARRTRPVRPDVPSGPLLSCASSLLFSLTSLNHQATCNSFTFFSALFDCSGQWNLFEHAASFPHARILLAACLPPVPYLRRLRPKHQHASQGRINVLAADLPASSHLSRLSPERNRPRSCTWTLNSVADAD